jgi:hypothetical protein
MRKWLVILAAAMTLTLTIAATVQARATVTHATLPSFYVDRQGNFFLATCEEHQVVNANHRKETFRCSFPEDIPDPVICDTAVGCSWSSDFDGAPAKSAHWVITPSGHMHGWANY